MENSDTGTNKAGPTSFSQNDQRFSDEVMDDLRVEALEAAMVMPNSPEVQALSKTLEQQQESLTHHAGIDSAAHVIVQPLEGVISLLAAELQTSRRKHQLIERDTPQAPPAYRDAVADYFEQLSREEQSSPEEDAPKSEEKQEKP